jgi:hypothetical protein
MPERFATQKPPQDYTGRLAHAQFMKHREDVERKLELQRKRIEQEQQELKEAGTHVPVAIEYPDPDESFIDYTDYHGQPTY